MLQYFESFSLCDPKKPSSSGEDIQLTQLDGLKTLPKPPIDESTPTTEDPFFDKTTCHLFVVIPHQIMYALESCTFGKKLPRGNICHTNLTGGKPAYCGGELWFCSTHEVAISGASGRYPPNTKEEMEAVETLFIKHGYVIRSLGWDEEANCPCRKAVKSKIKVLS